MLVIFEAWAARLYIWFNCLTSAALTLLRTMYEPTELLYPVSFIPVTNLPPTSLQAVVCVRVCTLARNEHAGFNHPANLKTVLCLPTCL